MLASVWLCLLYCCQINVMVVIYLAVEPVPQAMLWPGYVIFSWLIFSAYYKVLSLDWTSNVWILLTCSTTLVSLLHGSFMVLISLQITICDDTGADVGSNCNILSYIWVYMTGNLTVNWLLTVMSSLLDVHMTVRLSVLQSQVSQV